MSDSTNLSKKDLRYLRSAVTVAGQVSEMQRFRLGAVAVKSGRILSKGFNASRNKPSGWMPRHAWSTHAEEACLRRLPDGASGVTLYVARVGKSGKLLLSKPCDDCLMAAEEAGVSKIVFTEENNFGVIYI